jgi:hypothetical protein
LVMAELALERAVLDMDMSECVHTPGVTNTLADALSIWRHRKSSHSPSRSTGVYRYRSRPATTDSGRVDSAARVQGFLLTMKTSKQGRRLLPALRCPSQARPAATSASVSRHLPRLAARGRGRGRKLTRALLLHHPQGGSLCIAEGAALTRYRFTNLRSVGWGSVTAFHGLRPTAPPLTRRGQREGRGGRAQVRPSAPCRGLL